MNCFIYLRELSQSDVQTALDAVFTCLPTSPLRYRIEGGIELHEEDCPAAWFVAQINKMELPLLCNGDEKSYVGMSAQIFPKNLVVEREPLIQLSFDFPEESDHLASAPALFRSLASGLRPHWARMASEKAAQSIIDTVSVQYPAAPVGSRHLKMPARIPSMPGWLNFWSHEACRRLGFSRESDQMTLFERVEELDNGLVLQLTESPLDLEQAEHQTRLETLYRALPGLAQSNVS